MPIRFLRYVTELYESYPGKGSSGKLTAVFPILLYNGDRKWMVSSQLSDCIEPSIPADYIPHFKYFAVLENEIPKKNLINIKNALSGIFYIENSSNKELEENLDVLINIIKDENLEVVNILSSWFNNYLSYLEGIDRNEIQLKFSNILEVRNMFATRTLEHDKVVGQKFFEKGIEKGIEKGKQEGISEEKRRLARILLAMNLSVSQIMEASGLSEEEIIALK